MKQPVEEMFAGFTADGEASGHISTGREAALDGIADGFVFLLHFFADFYAGLIFLERFGADVRKVVVEDDGTFVHGEREDEIGVHDSFVGVDHEIGIDPEIEGAALASGGDILFGFCTGAEGA